MKESLVRTLSVPWAKRIAGRPLIDEFRRLPNSENAGLKWVVGNALTIVADEELFDEIAELVRDQQHGKSREMLALALGNINTPKAVDLLIDLLNDEQVLGHAAAALGKLRAGRAKTQVEALLKHPKSWVRREAKRALARINS